MRPAFLIWGLAAAVLCVPFLDVIRARPQWIRHATALRIVLAALEVGTVAVWALRLRGHALIGDPGTAAFLAGAGATLALVGAGLAAWARRALGPWFSPTFGVQRGHVLVTGGPYALVRHPIYLGLILFATGSAFVWNDAGLLGVAAVLTGLLALHVPVEERLFADHFGPAFAEYRARTPALLPWPRPRDPSTL